MWLSTSGCSFTPVYGDAARAVASNISFQYAAPTSLLEQIAYQDLKLSFPESTDPNAPAIRIAVAASRSAEALTRSGTKQTSMSTQVTAIATITKADGSEVQITRFATAGYSVNNQVLPSRGALEEANERAAKSAAESLRLAILAQLAVR
jgi:hypothetical protein